MPDEAGRVYMNENLGQKLNVCTPEENLSHERLAALNESKQLLMQFRDESLAWQEAYQAERRRAETLQEKLFEILGMNSETIPDHLHEIKHVVVPEQVGRRSMSFRDRKAMIESKLRFNPNDLQAQQAQQFQTSQDNIDKEISELKIGEI